MGFFEKLRAKGFWAFDRLSGGLVKKHLHDVEHIITSANNNETKVVVNNYVKKLLEHTSNTVPFYAKYKEVPLKDFPVISKKIITQNYDVFYSKEFAASDSVVKLTSGSTGEPFRIRQDQNKLKRNNADTIFFSKNAGYNFGTPLYFIRFWDVSLRKSNLQAIIQNMHPIDVIDFDNDRIIKLCSELDRSKKKAVSVLAYASAFDKLIAFLEQSSKQYDFSNVTSLIAISESLSNKTKKSANKFFKVPIVSRYSNTENGIIAQQLPNTTFPNRFYINYASYHVEIFDLENDHPVQNGELGRIIITDLFNYAMPLIRYDTGDLGVINIDKKGMPFLERIEGRLMDAIYDTMNNLVSSFIPTHLEEYEGILEYQFNQTGEKDYIISLVTDGQFKRENEIITFMKQHFGADSNILIKYLNSIPLLASGKRKKVLNTFKNPID